MNHRKGNDSIQAEERLERLESAVLDILNNVSEDVTKIDMNIRIIALQHKSTTTKSQISRFKLYKSAQNAKMQMREVLYDLEKVIPPKMLKQAVYNFISAVPNQHEQASVSTIVHVDKALCFVHILYMKKVPNTEKTFIEHLFGEEKYNATVMYKRICVPAK
jgi:acetylglutamate synthase